MARHPDNLKWTLLGVGSGLGGLLLAQGCAGACTACFGCVGSGVALASVALLQKCRSTTLKGNADGMAESFD